MAVAVPVPSLSSQPRYPIAVYCATISEAIHGMSVTIYVDNFYFNVVLRVLHILIEFLIPDKPDSEV